MRASVVPVPAPPDPRQYSNHLGTATQSSSTVSLSTRRGHRRETLVKSWPMKLQPTRSAAAVCVESKVVDRSAPAVSQRAGRLSSWVGGRTHDGAVADAPGVFRWAARGVVQGR